VDWSELNRADWADLIFYGVLAIYFATMIPKLFRGNFKGAVGALLFWITILFVVLAGYAYRYELRGVADRVLAMLVPGTPVETGYKEVTVIRRADGQFVVNGSVAGRRIPFVLDTGASAVVLRAEDAVKAKIPIDNLIFDVEVSTANGRAMAAEADIPRLSIGSITQRDVKALVARPGTLHENLLGMTFLSGLASFTVADDKLVLRGK
jgi:aspartyl protease family protein